MEGMTGEERGRGGEEREAIERRAISLPVPRSECNIHYTVRQHHSPMIFETPPEVISATERFNL